MYLNGDRTIMLLVYSLLLLILIFIFYNSPRTEFLIQKLDGVIMSLRYLPCATPMADSASFYLKLRNFLDAAIIEVPCSNMELLTIL
jgi:hypothetical protein